MAQSTIPYWNPLLPENGARWTPVQGLEAMAEELTLSVDVGCLVLELSFPSRRADG